jgi:hypothetical protein
MNKQLLALLAITFACTCGAVSLDLFNPCNKERIKVEIDQEATPQEINTQLTKIASEKWGGDADVWRISVLNNFLDESADKTFGDIVNFHDDASIQHLLRNQIIATSCTK